MAIGLKLPKNKEALAVVLSDIITRAEPYRNRMKVRTKTIDLYMQGVRNFGPIDPIGGTVVANYPIDAQPSFKFEGLLNSYLTELGRFLQVDLSPVATRLGQGLDGLRKASTAQVVFDDAVSKSDIASLTQALLPPFLRSGHMAFGAFADNGPPRIELIPGWELSSYPVDPVSSENIDALFRVRWVTLSWLVENKIITQEQANNNKVELNAQTSPIGTKPHDSPEKNEGWFSGTAKQAMAAIKGDKEKETIAKWVRFVETWVRDRNDYLIRYVAMAGRFIAQDSDLSNFKTPMPIQSARYVDSGGFYGRGKMEQLIPLNQEVEFMLSQMFTNVENFDVYGMLCISSQMGLSVEQVQQARSGEKVLVYNPDVYNPTGQPFVLPPANSGKMPLDIVNLGLGLMSNQSPQSEMMQGDAPGRVDSASALSLLYETSNVPLTGPTESIATALSKTYKALLWLIKQEWGDRKTVALTLDDDVLVGIKYNHKTGQVSLDKDAIPNPEEVQITVAAKVPQSISQSKAELKEQLAMQIITPREYRLQSRKLGLSMPVANDYEWQAYRKAKLENIILYGDGQSPGEIAVSPRDFHEVHLEVLQAFMARPEFPLASDAVQEFFKTHYDQHQEAMGNYPEGLPYPGGEDDLIQAAQARDEQENRL